MANTNVLTGLRCPNCESEGPFLIYVSVFGRAQVTDDGMSYDDMTNTESEFNTLMPVTCVECDFTDEFGAFETEGS